MKKLFVVAAIVLLCSISGFTQEKQNGIFQYSTIASLLEGTYDGNMTVKEFMSHGNFGIGTINNLDGEMVVMDNTTYQIRTDGIPVVLAVDAKIPFGEIVTFNPNTVFNISEVPNMDEFQKIADAKLISENLIYAFRVDGEFKNVKLRSVPIQKKPYPRLLEVIKNQVVFEYKDVKGTLIGFRMPKYMEGVNVGGYHFHFISADKKKGGHVLDFTGSNFSVKAQEFDKYNLVLPNTEDFLQKKDVKGNVEEVKKIEK